MDDSEIWPTHPDWVSRGKFDMRRYTARVHVGEEAYYYLYLSLQWIPRIQCCTAIVSGSGGATIALVTGLCEMQMRALALMDPREAAKVLEARQA